MDRLPEVTKQVDLMAVQSYNRMDPMKTAGADFTG